MTRPLLIADLLCGAGGTTTGAQRALAMLGREMVLTCVNHWPVAIDTHRRNHPNARHYVQDIATVRPAELVPEGYLDLLMASPTCTHHSRARGGRPTSDQQRADPWHIVTWLTELRVKRLLIENVCEFVEWGPVDVRTGRPVRSRKGEYFRAWIAALTALGFRVEWRKVNCADYGDATTRVRFILLGRSDGKPIAWPRPSHARDGSATLFGARERWRPAREIIDWGRAGQSIFTRKRPLAPKTLARIEAGARRFCWPEPFLVILRRHSTAASVDGPLPALTAQGTHVGLAQPVATPFVLAQGGGGVPRDVDEPLPTIVGKGAVSVTAPMLVPLTGGAKPKAARTVDGPLGTITTHNGVGMAEACLVNMKGRSDAASVDEPAPTLTAHARHLALAEAMVSPYYGGGSGETCKSVAEPLDTITTKARFGLVEPVVEPFVISPRHGRQGAGPSPRSAEQPLPTITVGGSQVALVEASAEPFLVAHFGERPGQAPRTHSTAAPGPSVTRRGAGDLVHASADPVIVQTDQTGGRGGYVRSVDDPLYTAVTKQNQAVVEPILLAPNTMGAGDEALRAAAEQGRVVLIDGQPHVLDIRFRMLEPYELARAMSFSDGETEYEFAGTKTEVTRQIGNAVPVRTACALVAALLHDAAVALPLSTGEAA